MPTNKLARCLLRSPLDCRIYLSFDSLIKQFSRRFYTRDIIRIRIKDIYIWSKKFNWQRTYRGRYIENIRENVDERDSSARGPIPLTISIRSTRAFLVHEIDCQFIDTPTRSTMLSLSLFSRLSLFRILTATNPTRYDCFAFRRSRSKQIRPFSDESFDDPHQRFQNKEEGV